MRSLPEIDYVIEVDISIDMSLDLLNKDFVMFWCFVLRSGYVSVTHFPPINRGNGELWGTFSAFKTGKGENMARKRFPQSAAGEASGEGRAAARPAQPASDEGG